MNAPRKILTGLFYTLGSTYCGRIFGFLAGLWLLPRLIDPATWGGVVLGASLYLVLISLKELGLAFALLHHQDRLDEMAPTHFLFNLLVSAGCIGLIIACAFAVQGEALQTTVFAYFFEDAKALGGYQVVAWTLFCLAAFNLLRSASITSETRLRARLEFKSLALIHMLGIILSLSVAVFLAWKGFGTWALIVGGTTSYVAHAPVYVVFTAICIWRLQPQDIKGLRWNREHARLLWRYGRWFWGGWVFSAIIIEYPKIIAGGLLGWDELGYYAIAYYWAQMPTGAITHVLIGLTNPVYARYQTNRERLTLVFGKMLRLIVRTTALLAMIFLLEAERLIPLISGPEWIRSVELLRWMVIYALFRPFLDDIQALLLAVGVPETIAKINGIVTGATVVGIPLLVYAWGLKGIAIGAGSAAALGAGLSFYWVRHYVDIAWMQAFFKPALSVGASLGAMALLDGIIPGDGWTALVFRLAIEILLYGVLLVVLEGRELYEEVVDLRRILGQKEDEAQV